MDEYLLFETFERGEYINKKDLPKITNYKWGHLISWSPNSFYFERQYNYVNKLKIVHGSENVGCLVTLKKENHYAKKNLLTFLKKKNIKIAFARQCDKKNLLGNSYREMRLNIKI